MSPKRYLTASAQQWDAMWRDKAETPDQARQDLLHYMGSVEYARIMDALRRRLGDLNGKRAIEVGAGKGTFSAALAREGVAVTLLDFSPVALELAQIRFRAAGLTANFIHGDAFDLSAELQGKFDIVSSFGLAEHFEGARRQEIFRSHHCLARAGGCVVIAVPNSSSVPYRVYMLASKLMDTWALGLEKPFTMRELRRRAESAGLGRVEIFGSSAGKALRDFPQMTGRDLRWFLYYRVARGPLKPLRLLYQGYRRLKERLMRKNKYEGSPSRETVTELSTSSLPGSSSGEDSRLDRWFGHFLVLIAQRSPV